MAWADRVRAAPRAVRAAISIAGTSRGPMPGRRARHPCSMSLAAPQPPVHRFTRHDLFRARKTHQGRQPHRTAGTRCPGRESRGCMMAPRGACAKRHAGPCRGRRPALSQPDTGLGGGAVATGPAVFALRRPQTLSEIGCPAMTVVSPGPVPMANSTPRCRRRARMRDRPTASFAAPCDARTASAPSSSRAAGSIRCAPSRSRSMASRRAGGGHHLRAQARRGQWQHPPDARGTHRLRR